MAITTAEQLLEAGDIGPCELVRGELTMMMLPGGRHGELVGLLTIRLGAFVAETKAGKVLGETGFVLSRDPDTVRGPDVAFLRSGRAIDSGFIDGAPELVVEVVLPGDRPGYVREKVAEWLDGGAEAVWVVDPRARSVTVHERMQAPRVFEEADTLVGGSVLPAFTLDLRELFAR